MSVCAYGETNNACNSNHSQPMQINACVVCLWPSAMLPMPSLSLRSHWSITPLLPLFWSQALFKRRGWAQALEAGMAIETTDMSLLIVQITATGDGIRNHVDEVR